MDELECLEQVVTGMPRVADARDLLIEWQTKQIKWLENQNHELLKMVQTLSTTSLDVTCALNPPPGPPAPVQDPYAVKLSLVSA